MRSPFSRRHLLALAPLLTLMGCGFGPAPAPRKFALLPLAPGAAKGPSLTLGIGVPRALKTLDSERIADRPGPYEMQYFAGADWVDRAPLMLQLLFLRSFQNQSALTVSASDSAGPLPDYLLNFILEDFQTDHESPQIAAHVTLVATLERTGQRQALQSRSFSAREMAGSDHMEDIIKAFDRAVAKIAGDLIDWTISQIGKT